MSRNDRNQPLSDPALETLLREHFAGELDAHAGSSARRFGQYIGPGPDDATLAAVPRSAPGRTDHSTRIWWAVPLLAAAAAVALVIIPAMRLVSVDAPVISSSATPPSAVPGATPSLPDGSGQTVLTGTSSQPQGDLWWEYRDAGRVYLDEHTVARRMLKTEYQRVQWTDPTDRSRIEITVPRQEVVLVSAPRY